MVEVSVLMAVYNAEQYLCESLDSLLAQTMKSWEVICVDDGSTDRSWAILQQYASKDSRIRIVRLTQNMGQGHARNVGLAKATGSYVAFLDSDDWLAEDALEQIVACFHSDLAVDSVLFRLCYVYPDGRMEPYPGMEFRALSGSDAFVRSLDWKVHGVYVVQGRIHRQWRYDERTAWYSDDNLTRIHYLNSRKVCLSQGVYYYRQHERSVTHRVDVRRFDYLKANMAMKQYLEEIGVSDGILSIYEEQRWLNLVDSYYFYFTYSDRLSERDRKEGLRLMKDTWSSMQTELLPRRLKWKFGYAPLHCSWKMFRLQEQLYFFFRRLLGK